MMKLKQKVLHQDVKNALNEDIGTGDVTSALLPDDLLVQARIFTREPMLVCGQPWVNAVFAEVDPSIKVTWAVEEGMWLPAPTTLCHLHGLARSILQSERTALNFLQTLAGVATTTYRYVQQIKSEKVTLLDTRKTIPGLRMAQKYAVACGGGSNHRQGLFDAFLIKENHIKACGSITQAVEMARNQNNGLQIEVEVESLDELKEALQTKPDRILLDNFNQSQLQEAVQVNNGLCELEASGGIDMTNIRRVAETGVNYISVGAITKSLQAIDLTLLIDKLILGDNVKPEGTT